MIALGALVMSLAVAAAPDPFKDLPPGTPVRTYVVQPGDSVWSIAAEFYGSGDRYEIVYKFNNYVGRPPYLLSPGQVLRLPVLGRGPEAQIEWLRRDVKAKPPRALDWLEAREKMNLWRLYRVSTGDASAAHIVFEDESDIRLREQAMLVIYGASASAAQTQRSDKHEVVLEQGTLQGGLAKLDAAAGAPAPAPLVVKTPSGQVDILGKLTQIEAEAVASMISAFDGGARVSAKGASVEVAEGQGTVVEKGKVPQKPRPLPAAPAWEDPAPALVVALPGDDTPAFEARWRPVDGAASYRVELAANGDFKNVSYDAEVGSGVTRLRLEALGEGQWAVRVSTRDKSKLESKPGVARQVVVAHAAASRRVTAAAGRVQAVGVIELRAPDGLAVAADGAAAGASARLFAGAHKVVWTHTSGARTESEVEVVPVAGEMTLAGEPLGRGEGSPVRVSVTMTDASGKPALLPGVVIETSAHGPLPTHVDGAVASADIPAIAENGPMRVKVRASWPGGVLAERELDVTAPSKLPPPPTFAWQDSPTTPYRRVRGLSQTLGTTTPTSSVALDTDVADLDAVGLDLGLALRGELALLGGDLGLDAGFTFQQIALSGDADPQSAPGDAWLGLRWRAVGEGGTADAFELTPYLRLGVPVGRGESARVLGVEPGVLARIRIGGPYLDLRAAALIRAGSDDYDTAGFDGLAAFTWGPMSLSYRGVLDGGDLLSQIGLGAALPLGRVRLGLALGYGLDARAQAVLGGFSGRVTLDVGL